MNATLWSEIRQLYFVKKLYKKEIARRLGLSVKTVRRALKLSECPGLLVRRNRSSQLDPFKNKIAVLLREYPLLSAVRFHEEIKALGYEGGITILRDYLRKVRPSKQETFLRIETDPGEEGQVDWGLFGDYFGCGRILSCFAFVLSHSRMMTLSWTLSQRLEDFLSSHQKAFGFFGGIPKKILYDNLKSVVLSRMGKEVRFNPKFMAFAGTYLFEPVACNVRRGNEKGKVERSIGYIRTNFFEGRTFRDIEDLRAQSDRWRDTVANVRIHGTTRTKPIDRFAIEKPCLRPLGEPPLSEKHFDVDVVLPVVASKDCRITFDSNVYSTPMLYAGVPLTLRADDQRILLYKQDRLIASHRRSWKKYQSIEDPKHVEEILEEKRRGSQAKERDLFLSLGSGAEDYLKGLVQTPRSFKHELKKINALITVYGNTEVLQAIHQAIPFKAFGADYLKNIIFKNLTQRGEGHPIGPVNPSLRPDLADLKVEERSLENYGQLAEEKETEMEEMKEIEEMERKKDDRP